MQQLNMQAIVLEALRQSGYALRPGESSCTACCAGEKAVRELVRMGTVNGHAQDLYRFVMESVERPLIQKALERSGGNQLAAARMLGINRNTLRARMRSLGVMAQRPNNLSDPSDPADP